MQSALLRAVVAAALALPVGALACTPSAAPSQDANDPPGRPLVALRPLIKASKPLIKGGKMDEKSVTSRVELDEAALRACYMDGLRRNEKLAGRIVLDLNVNVAGEVEACTVALSQLRDDEVDECIRNVAARWKFPSSVEGTLRQVSLPLTLVTRIERVIET